ncbi:MAG: (2Fe-2S)-binding protein [Bdellovibrionales bacterium]|nr:(2Fe-2S)-binding protein [Bdellovibrionales bacterium]
MNPADKNPKRTRFICLCNSVPQDVIEAAIARGCNTLSKVFDATTAGVGPCGGSCQPVLRRMLDSYLANGEFPENPNPQSSRKSRRR